jgi:hypothetical protein
VKFQKKCPRKMDQTLEILKIDQAKEEEHSAVSERVLYYE